MSGVDSSCTACEPYQPLPAEKSRNQLVPWVALVNRLCASVRISPPPPSPDTHTQTPCFCVLAGEGCFQC